jgi:hypothetical protein
MANKNGSPYRFYTAGITAFQGNASTWCGRRLTQLAMPQAKRMAVLRAMSETFLNNT